MKKYNVAVVGATGMVGRKFLEVLTERQLPVENYYLFASAKSAGKEIDFMGKPHKVIELNEKNISLFSGLIGFVLIFILFDFHIYTVELLLPESADIIESYEYTSYFLFFAKSGKVYYSIASPIFFSIFIISFVLYLTLLILSKKVTHKLKFLGIIGVILNTTCIILFFVFLFSIYISILDYQFSEYWYMEFDFSIILTVLITFEFFGLYGNYASWIYTCKKYKERNIIEQTNEPDYESVLQFLDSLA